MIGVRFKGRKNIPVRQTSIEPSHVNIDRDLSEVLIRPERGTF